MLLQEGTSRCTGVLHLSYPLKTLPHNRLMFCTQEWTESWLLREVDGHQSLRPPTHWRVYLPTHPTTEGPVPSCLPGAWVWVQMDEKKGELNLCVACFISTSHVFFCCPADAPHFTSITVFPAGEVTEGGSVTLTCSSDAAPLAESFAWFKGMVAVFCRNRSSASINAHFHVHSAFYLRVM